jgi:hypothetical protein
MPRHKHQCQDYNCGHSPCRCACGKVQSLGRWQWAPATVTIEWVGADVKTLCPRWSLAKCEEFLLTHATQLQDRSIERGWELLENLLARSRRYR